MPTGNQWILEHSTPWMEGPQLDQDARAGVRFHPAAEETGIVFVRSDLPGNPEIRCVPENLQSMPRWTSLAADGHWVHHTEHILAAIALCDIDNIVIEMDSDRIPLMPDGSCSSFVDALRTAGLTKGAQRRCYCLKEPLCLWDAQSLGQTGMGKPPVKNGRYILALPADHLAISTVFHWSHEDGLPIGIAEYESLAPPDPLIIQARSYLVESEKAMVENLLGPIRNSLMTLYPGCPAKLAQEAARHKIVDFIGDLMVLGRPLLGRFAAFRSGHRIHHDLVRHLVSHNLLNLQTIQE